MDLFLVLSEMFNKILRRRMNVSSPREDTTRGHFSITRRERCRPSDSLLASWRRDKHNRLQEEEEKLLSRINPLPTTQDANSRTLTGRGHGPTVTRAPSTLSSLTSPPNVTTSVPKTSETDGKSSFPASRPSHPCFTSCAPCPSTTASPGTVCFRSLCRPTMSSGTEVPISSTTITTATTTGTETETTISVPSPTYPLTEEETLSATEGTIPTLTPTSTTSSSAPVSTSSDPTETELPAPTETETDAPALPSPPLPTSTPSSPQPPPSTVVSPTQEESVPSTTPSSATLTSSPLPTITITSSQSESLPSTGRDTSEVFEELSTTTEAEESSVFMPAPIPSTRSPTRATTTRTRTVTRPTFSTFTFTTVVTSTYTDGTTTFTSVVETGILATDAPSDNGGFAMNVPGIIGVSLGSAVFLILLVLSLFFCSRRIRNTRTPSNSPSDSSTSIGNLDNGGWSPPLMDDDERHMRLISNRMRGLYGAAAAALSHLSLSPRGHARGGDGDAEKGLRRGASTKSSSGAGSEESTAVGHANAENGPVLAPPSYEYTSGIRSNSDEKSKPGDTSTPHDLDLAGRAGMSGEGDQVAGGKGTASLRKHHSLYGPRPCPSTSTHGQRRHSSTPTALTQHLLTVQAEHAAHAGVSEFGEIPVSDEMKKRSQKGLPWYHLSSNDRRGGEGIPNPFATASSSSESVKGMVEIPTIPISSRAATTLSRPPSSLLNPPHPISHTPLVLDTNAGLFRSIPPPILTFPRSITGNSYTTTSSKNPFASPPLTPPSPALTQRTVTDDGSSFKREGLLHPALLGHYVGAVSPGIEQADSVASLRDHLDYSRPIGSGLVNVVARQDSLNTLGSVGEGDEQQLNGKAGRV